MTKFRKKILVIRNDKIGDFMLAWPAFALLKTQYPNAEITALVPEYTAPLAEYCEWIDNVLIDEKKPSTLDDIITLYRKLKQSNYDISISIFSETRTSLSLVLAGIKLRFGPATKIAQIFLNKRLRQKRSRSKKPEFEYNVDLIKFFIRQNGDHPKKTPAPPYMSFDRDEINLLKEDIRDDQAIADDRMMVIIHPGTGGSAINLSISQYAEIINNLSKLHRFHFIITAGPGEEQQARSLSDKIKTTEHHVHVSQQDILQFCMVIDTCDLFISGSTGPLHIAGALNKYTVAFYPEKKSATHLRWKTLNEERKQLSFTMPRDKELNTSQIHRDIHNKFFQHLIKEPFT